MGEADYVHSFALVPVFQALGGLMLRMVIKRQKRLLSKNSE